MRTLYVDAFSGISGNMFIGALLDLGLEVEGFLDHTREMGIKDEEFILQKVIRQGISSTYFNLKGEEEKIEDQDLDSHNHRDHDHTHHHHEDKEGVGETHHHDHSHTHHHHRNLKDVMDIIDSSSFSDQVKETAKSIFTILAQAEASVHGSSLSKVHFHEVGELDSIIDCLGAAYFFHALEVDQVIFGPINTGAGIVKCAHGNYPIPTPATAAILTKIKAPIGGVYQDKELTTPTGAAIAACLYDRFESSPKGQILGTGYGAGTRDNALPNVLRILLLEEEEESLPVWYSCNVDDMSGEELGFLMDKLFESGARDVSFTPIFMKKNRPGQRIDVLGDMGVSEELKSVLFAHSSTLGIKKIPLEKIEMDRSFKELNFGGQLISCKKASYGDISKSTYEYEDVKKIAKMRGWSIRDTIKKLNECI